MRRRGCWHGTRHLASRVGGRRTPPSLRPAPSPGKPWANEQGQHAFLIAFLLLSEVSKDCDLADMQAQASHSKPERISARKQRGSAGSSLQIATHTLVPGTAARPGTPQLPRTQVNPKQLVARLGAAQPDAQQARAHRLHHQHIRLVGRERHAVGKPQAVRQHLRAPAGRFVAQQPPRVRGLQGQGSGMVS